jgi:hypothetical protein
MSVKQQILSGEAAERMQFIRAQVERTILPYRENTEAALVAGALVQIARVLFELYPEKTRTQLLTGAVAYLQRDNLEPQDSPLLVLPKGVM